MSSDTHIVTPLVEKRGHDSLRRRDVLRDVVIVVNDDYLLPAQAVAQVIGGVPTGIRPSASVICYSIGDRAIV